MLVDGRHLLFRTADAHRDLVAQYEDGEIPTGGIFGVLNVLVKLRKRFGCSVMIAWEGVDNFRLKLYPNYKFRPAPTSDVIQFREELFRQEMILREILSKLGVRQYDAIGGEADDVLATLAFKAQEHELEVGIFTGDSDLLQCVTDHCRVVAPQPRNKEKIWDVVAVASNPKMPVLVPSQVPLFKALSGDTSDNIPGVKGIGPATAGHLICQFGTLEGIVEAAKNPSGPWPVAGRFRELILSSEGDLKLFLKLTTVRHDITIKLVEIDCDPMAARRLMALLKFRKLLEQSSFAELKRLHA